MKQINGVIRSYSTSAHTVTCQSPSSPRSARSNAFETMPCIFRLLTVQFRHHCRHIQYSDNHYITSRTLDNASPLQHLAATLDRTAAASANVTRRIHARQVDNRAPCRLLTLPRRRCRTKLFCPFTFGGLVYSSACSKMCN
jgi:hypothetical protein